MRSFAQLFRGRDDVFGTYRLPDGAEVVEGEKLLGQGRTEKKKLTDKHWKEHLEGKNAIGIIPIMPGANDCWWFAIDVDRYGDPRQHYEFEKKIQKLGLPIVVFRSKSNGVHLYCFLTKPISAKIAMETMRKWTKLLGIGKCDMYPRQDTLRPGDDGNWINIPYFGETRKAIGLKGEDLSLDEFLQLAHSREISPADLGSTAEQASKAADAGEHPGAPPCIQTMMRDGLHTGRIDDGLFHVGVYMKKAFPDTWQEKLSEWNTEYCQPPAKFSDVARIIGSLEKKDYQYRCKVLEDICDKGVCKTREFGVGTGESDRVDFEVERLEKIDSDPPVWIVHVFGKQARLTTEELMMPEAFRKAILMKTNRMVAPMTRRAWEKYLTLLLERLEVHAAPDDISAHGQIIAIFRDWTTRMVPNAKTIADVLEARPFYMKEEKMLIWRGIDLLTQISRVNPSKINEKLVWSVMREEGAEVDLRRIEGKPYKLWKLRVADPWFPLPSSASAF